MSENQKMTEDIVGSHGERMKNLSKYYPFFKLWESGLSAYKDGAYADVDMPYITMALLRYFIEQNQFNQRAVTGQIA